jgi:molybdopterin/thiamine biosynthesis adenylyltransferase/proteasome lid subunit RPN8/RPN11
VTITRIVMLDAQLDELRQKLFDRPGVEGAAFLLCGQSVSEDAVKLIVHAVVPIADEDYLRREKYGLTIASPTLTRVAKLARYEGLSVVFAHSHPEGVSDFSEQDNREEAKLLPFLQARVAGRVHGTLVLTEHHIQGRLYMPDQVPVDEVIAIGGRIRSWTPKGRNAIEPFFDRQVRAFGQDIQSLLRRLRIGIVGVGGTGSPVAEQLYRLGVGHLRLFDGDRFAETNVNRVYGSSLQDDGKLKVEMAKEHLDRIGLTTTVDIVPQHITNEAAARALRDCDIVFGCTDKELPRTILVQLANRYCIPVFDLGVLIDSRDGCIIGVHGRVTTLMPGEACLFCRGRITAETIRIEALSDEDRQRQIRDGYAPELDEPAPAVIAFTSATASAAVMELLHRLTGFMGSERLSSEVLLALDQTRLRTNRIMPRDGCICEDRSFWGRGDVEPFLEMMWPTSTK